MAFENLYGNIDFQAGNKMDMAKQQQFAQMLGMGMQAAQASADRKLKERQMEIKSQQVDLKSLSENAAMKAQMGMPLTPEEQAALEVRAQTSAPVVYTDAYGNQVVRESGWAGMGGQTQGINPNARNRPPVMGSPQDAIYEDLSGLGGGERPMPPSDMRLSIEDLQNVPQMDMSQLGGNIPFQEPRDVVSTDTYKAPARFGVKGEIMEEESKQKASDTAVSGAIKEKQAIEKQMREAKRPLFEPMEGFTPSKDDTKTMTKLVVSKKMLDGLIDDYTKAVDKYGVSIGGSEGAKVIDRAAGKIRMQVKNLEELGALQEPDVRAMNEMLGSAVLTKGDVLNPLGGYTQIKEGDKIAKESMSEFKRYVDGVVKNNAEVRGFKLNIPQAQQSSGWGIKRK